MKGHSVGFTLPKALVSTEGGWPFLANGMWAYMTCATLKELVEFLLGHVHTLLILPWKLWRIRLQAQATEVRRKLNP